ncbi:hypothetical protein [Persephonella sp.]
MGKMFLSLLVLILISIKASACYSDYGCPVGYLCVKPPYSIEGKCMKAVDEFGLPTYPLPRSDSIMPRTERDCDSNMDCPIGFYCDRKYGVCIKR